MSGTALFAVVQKGKAQTVFANARSAGSTGGTILMAKGTAPSNLLSILGFSDSKKEVVLTLCDKDLSDNIFDAMAGTEKTEGVVFAIDCERSYIKQTVQVGKGEAAMDTGWKMINVICNQGFSEEVMKAARDAGAGGGTVMAGRGTGTPDDARFFGIQLVPEKEMLLILVDSARHDTVFDAITALPCMQDPGSGIVYTMPVSRFSIMGKPKS
ncbi:MAG: transcriptional regulator [Sphaerochaetaceae bacterium]|jgi:nitrogen regulatory protein PII|nr:transcriptional regulator [Sphaerochaetaceae bacterium]MDD3163343.1 transcriptional regulator [Sphaerochaetaceae bacterium]MDD4007196.1 transcriptional regulator [Sphaerochaetaceae bacterium]MDD4396484.1 transcriptional regulator [Sphaerochaetaceae bacterium]